MTINQLAYLKELKKGCSVVNTIDRDRGSCHTLDNKEGHLSVIDLLLLKYQSGVLPKLAL